MSLGFSFTAEQERLRRRVIEFARKYSSEMEGYEQKSLFPAAVYRKMGEKGWTGSIVPREFGGMGKGSLEYCIISEELSRYGVITPQVSIQAAKAILAGGTQEQKQRFLPFLAKGEYIASIAISEAEAGSSFYKMNTQARKEGSDYVINGSKTHINLAADADILILYATAPMGLTPFIVERGTPGMSVKKLDPLGMRLMPIYEITFENCRVPQNNLLGAEGQGIDLFFQGFNLSRLGNASEFLGAARGALEYALEYATRRPVGPRVVTDFQGLRWQIAELSSKIEAASLLRYKAAWLGERGLEHSKETAMAKLMAGEAAISTITQVFSLVGAYGCYRNTPLERYWREIQVLRVAGGSLEVMKNLIARTILGKETD